MLQVKTKVKESNIPGAGLGLFAGQFIPKGTIIWMFNEMLDQKVYKEDIIFLSEIERIFIDTYAYLEGDYYIICVDSGKYINHSFTPNTDDYVDSKLGSVTVANKDIEEGEEIVSNYESFDSEFSTYSHMFK